MQIELGNNIRHLRRRDGRTQEALAEALGVTSQAVSRWESGGSFPDINLIPSIANYFGVTIDELFGYENQRQQRIDALYTKINNMLRQNYGADKNISQCIAMARDALVEYPGNEKLMLCLASALSRAGYVRYGQEYLVDGDGYIVYDTQKHRTYEEWREAILLYEKVLERLPMGSFRDRAMEELSQLYLNLGYEEKACALAESAPSIWNAKEFLRAYAFDGKRGVEAKEAALLNAVHAAAVFIVNITTGSQKHFSPAEKVDSIQRAIGMFELICPDGNFGSHYGYVASLHMLLSLYLWLDGKKEEAFAALDAALENEKKMQTACENGVIHYSAPLVRLVKEKAPCTAEEACADLLSMPEEWPWWTVPEAEAVKAEMQASPHWNAWVAKIK